MYVLLFNTHMFTTKMAVSKLRHYCLKNEEEIDGCKNKIKYTMINFMHPVFYITTNSNDSTMPEHKKSLLYYLGSDLVPT